MRCVWVALSIVCIGAVSAGAQPADSDQRVTIEPRQRPALEEIRRATFRLDVKLIQIPVIVTDLHDRLVMGLRKDQFRIFEDDVEQKVVTLSMADTAISSGLVFDASGSMHNHIRDTREAVRQFLLSTVPGDEFFLVRFSDSPKLVTPWTPSTSEIWKQLAGVRARGWTAMNDAVFRSLQEMRRARNPRRVLLVLTDGADNNSRYSDGELLSLVREADVGVFAIGLFERPRLLEKLADETGGRVLWVRKVNDLAEAMEKLSLEIRNQYVAGYFSNRAPNDGRYHKIRVEVTPPAGVGPVRASWRRGYTAP